MMKTKTIIYTLSKRYTPMLKFLAVIFSTIITLTSFANDDIIGIWQSNSAKAQVEIYKVKGKYYGRVIRLNNARDERGFVKLDKKNPDRNLQGKPIEGLVVLSELIYNEDTNQWNDGKIYNPEDGRIYKCQINLKDSNTMNVRGYIGISCFGKTQTMLRIR